MCVLGLGAATDFIHTIPNKSFLSILDIINWGPKTYKCTEYMFLNQFMKSNKNKNKAS